jgi:ligand-binding sensor domain-containing protein
LASVRANLSRFFLFLLVLSFVLPSQPCHALNPATPVNAYRHDVFDSRAGAPRDAFSMAQTADGWIWFATPTGLYRYDGIRFETFRPAPGEHLLGQYIAAVLPLPNGDLWISYLFGGISVLHQGHLRHLPAASGTPLGKVMNFALDGNDVWAASPSGLFRFRNGGWERFGADKGFPDKPAYAVYCDHYGRVWASDTGNVYVLDRAAGRFDRLFGTAGDTVFVTSPDGRVWAADGNTVRLLPAPPSGWRVTPPPPVRQNADQTLFDRDGNYWAGNCPDGTCVLRPQHQQVRDGRFPDLTAMGVRNDGCISKVAATVTALMEDREGNLWSATSAGVERLRDTRLIPIALPPASGWPSMALDAAGTVWIASTNQAMNPRLWKIEDGFPVQQQPGQRSVLVTRGRDDTVLVAGDRWIERRRSDKLLARYPMPRQTPAIRPRSMAMLLAEDREGIWLYQGGRGMFRLRDGTWAPVPAQAGLARAIYAFVDAQGRTWFGMRDNRVVMQGGQHHREYGAEDGVALGAVTFVHADGDLLISGDNGTAIWNGRRFRPLQADDVDLANVSGYVTTGDGDRWLNTKRGLFHVSAADWQRSMVDTSVPVRGVLLDELDGFPGAGYGISPVPTLQLGRDGRLWVSGTDGVAVLDRSRLTVNMTGPAVSVLGLTADGRHYANGLPSMLPAGTGRLRFDFSAPSFTMPERVRFNYRLVGFDRGWLNAGAARSASYTNLGPGEYRL